MGEVVRCSQCGKRFRLQKEKYRGHTVSCSGCGGAVRIPTQPEARRTADAAQWVDALADTGLAMGSMGVRYAPLGLGLLAFAGIWVEAIEPWAATLAAVGLWLAGATFARDLAVRSSMAAVGLASTVLCATALVMSW